MASKIALGVLSVVTVASGLSSLLSNDGVYCAQGPSRLAESAIAMKKASPIGGLFNTSFGVSNATCTSRGYTLSFANDNCTNGVEVFHKSLEDMHAWAKTEGNALDAWAANYGVNDSTASLMHYCTCQPGSSYFDNVANRCPALDSMEGSWIHRSPYTGDRMMCDQGPFVFITRVLATIKSSPQLAMHFRDQIAATTCSQLGFPYLFSPPDHCYSAAHIWTATADIATDPGIMESEAVERNLTTGGGFASFAQEHGIGDMDILNNNLGCNCLATSSVGKDPKLQAYCKSLGETGHSPVRDWWSGNFPNDHSILV